MEFHKRQRRGSSFFRGSFVGFWWMALLAQVTLQPPPAASLRCHQCVTSHDGVVRTEPCLNVPVTGGATSKNCDNAKMNYCAKTTFVVSLSLEDIIKFTYKLMARHCIELPTQQFQISGGCIRMKSLNLTALGIKLPFGLEARSDGMEIDFDSNEMTRGQRSLEPRFKHGTDTDKTSRKLLDMRIANIRGCACNKDDCNNFSGHKSSADDKCL